MKKIFALLLFFLLAQMLVAQEDCSGISGNISPSNEEICQGASVLLTATGGSSYEWRLNDVIIDGETGNTLNATQSGTYSVIIIEGECRVPASNTSEITVNPTPTGTISPASASICDGGSVELTATGGDSYTWFRNGVEINGNNATITADEPGTYSVIIHVNDCSGEASNTSVVTLSSGPTGTISPANASICAGESVVLTATGGNSYTWFRNGDEINGQHDATLNVTQAGTYTVNIQQGDCSGAASNSSVVTVSSAPTGSISPANASICAGGSAVLTATGGSSYTWFLNGVEINGEDNATLTVTQAGTYTATIHQGDCSASASNSSVVTVSSSPTGTISPANASICEGGSVVLTATGGSSYTWFRNGDEISGEHDATLNVTQAGTYSVIINQGDCSGAASNTSAVTVAAPTGTISPASGSICEGGSMILTATGGTSYTWFRNGDEINGRTGATLTVTQEGTYSAIINQDDCSGPASNTSVVTLSSSPTGTISPATGSICGGGSLVLTATGGSSYTWFLNGNEINGKDDATITVTQPGTYSVIIQQGDCSGAASNTSVVTLAASPTGNITPATSSICSGGSQVLTVTGGSSYKWFRDGDEIPGQTGATLTVSQAGTYSATIQQGECSGPAANTAVVSLAAVPSGTITPATGSICEGGSLILTATGGTSYTWFLNGTEIPNQTANTLNVTAAGIYFVIIRNGSCSGPAINTSVITLATAPTGTISPETGSLCEGGSLILTATGGSAYTWLRDGTVIIDEEAATISITQPGTYTAIIKNGDCTGPASNSAVITSEILSGTRYPDINARPNVPVQLSARENGTTYQWSPAADLSDPASRTPTVNTLTDREYVVRITTESGCLFSDTVLVKVKAVIYVPTAFTPDGNGTNDILRPRGEFSSLQYFKVYNRWGQMVFETKEVGVGWDGKFKGAEQPSDTYTWLMAGTGADGQPIKLSGKTFLIR